MNKILIGISHCNIFDFEVFILFKDNKYLKIINLAPDKSVSTTKLIMELYLIRGRHWLKQNQQDYIDKKLIYIAYK